MQTKLALEDEVHEVLELLRPLYVFEKKETNLDTLKQIHTKLPLVIERLSEKVGQDHNCTKEMEFISDRTEVAIWCLENLDLESKWTADTVFELCKNESCNFTLLNQLGVLKTLKEEDARTLLAKQAAAFDFYKHNLAVSRILPFLFKEFRENANDQPVSIKDIERLLKDITSVNLRIRTLHEIYELCFLRKEDAQNNARTEEVNEETKVKSQGAEAALENVNRPPLESPEISAASQVEPASKVSSDVTAYLCRDTKKLKVTL